MNEEPVIERRTVLKGAALLTSLLVLPAFAATPDAHDAGTPADATTLAEVPYSTGAGLTVERRGAIALFGINRPHIQNRVDPATFIALARAYYDYDHDPSLRAAILFGHGDDFSRGIDVNAFKALAGTGKPLISGNNVIDPLAKTRHLTKPLIVVVHGDTWNMGHELHLVADIRIAAANTRFGQDENTHGRFPGGGSTVRFVRDAGWGNAMRYILTGDHWSADDAYRMGVIQEVAPTQQAALERGIAIATKIAACGPLGIRTSLASAHLAIDTNEAASLAQLDAQYGALYRTQDFQEGRNAEAEGRAPVYQGK
ncbi:enoyl-CoA hydratase-related protein [Paraburkholderia acidicola]|uniref:Enoyl-CoA hydratase-related protein n=1 Tax=Paraburkholderia acidicola TaxID=1912599 RepID=A0ABV1LY92_9BURK